MFQLLGSAINLFPRTKNSKSLLVSCSASLIATKWLAFYFPTTYLFVSFSHITLPSAYSLLTMPSLALGVGRREGVEVRWWVWWCCLSLPGMATFLWHSGSVSWLCQSWCLLGAVSALLHFLPPRFFSFYRVLCLSCLTGWKKGTGALTLWRGLRSWPGKPTAAAATSEILEHDPRAFKAVRTI